MDEPRPVEFRYVYLGNAGTPSDDIRVGPRGGPVLRLAPLYWPQGARIEMVAEGEDFGPCFEVSKDDAERLAEIFMYIARHGTTPGEGVAGCRYTTIGSDGEEYIDE